MASVSDIRVCKGSQTDILCLVVDPEAVPSRKRSRGALNFFKFAETVEQNAWDDEKQKRDLEAGQLFALRSGGYQY